jgi:cellobiose-specific phosphotransferase system component IIA
MGIMDWFKQVALGELPPQSATPGPAAASEDHGAEVGGLNFKSAIDAHMKWKMRLENYINGTSEEQLKVEVVCRDDQCPLGKWIYSRGAGEFGYSDTFFDMKAHHAIFHRCAGEVLSAAQQGDHTKAMHLLHHGDYVRASERVKKLLAKLFVLVADGKTAIDAHVRWKEQLRAHITGKGDEDINIENAGRDDLCALGIWFKNDGAQHYGGTPGFEAARAAHTRFHQCASEVLALAGQGRSEEALEMLEDGKYAQASDEVTAALVDLFANHRR